MLRPDANPGSRGGKPATNRLSYGTAITDLLEIESSQLPNDDVTVTSPTDDDSTLIPIADR
jgi:hypothetical protein